MASGAVSVDGLKEFRAGLKRLDAELPKELRQEFLAIGRRVADDARGHVPRRTGRAAASIKAGVSGNNAYVQGGKKRVPYYGWLDFGGQVPSKKSGKTARTVRPRLKEGRYLYPAIRRRRRDIVESAAAAIETVAVRSLPRGKT